MMAAQVRIPPGEPLAAAASSGASSAGRRQGLVRAVASLTVAAVARWMAEIVAAHSAAVRVEDFRAAAKFPAEVAAAGAEAR